MLNHVVGLYGVMRWGGGTGLLAVMGLRAVMWLHTVMWLRRGAGARHVHVVGSGQDVHPDDPGNDRQQPCQQARAAQEQSCAVRQGRGQVFLLPCRMGYFKSTGRRSSPSYWITDTFLPCWPGSCWLGRPVIWRRNR